MVEIFAGLFELVLALILKALTTIRQVAVALQTGEITPWGDDQPVARSASPGTFWLHVSLIVLIFVPLGLLCVVGLLQLVSKSTFNTIADVSLFLALGAFAVAQGLMIRKTAARRSLRAFRVVYARESDASAYWILLVLWTIGVVFCCGFAIRVILPVLIGRGLVS